MRPHAFVCGVLLLTGGSLFAATVAADPSQAEIDKIIATFASNESAFAKARENYTSRQTARIQELEDGGIPLGRWELVSDIIFDQGGKRTEKVVRAPMANLQRIIMSPED